MGLVHESLHIFRLRWQAGEIEGGAADERAAIGFGGGGELLFAERGGDEGIDGGGFGDGLLEGPPFGGASGGGGGGGPGGARVDPFAEYGDIGIGELGAGGHSEFGIGMGNRAKEQAGGGLAGNQRRAALAALEGEGAGIQAQTRERDGAGVTAPAVFLEDAERLIGYGGQEAKGCEE